MDDVGGLVSLPTDTLLTILPNLLSDTDTQLPTIRTVLERLTTRSSEADSISEAKQILQVVSLNLTSSLVVTKMFTELLAYYEHPLLVIEVLASIVGDSEDEVSMVIQRYKELVNLDRTLLIPILGSLSELALTEEMKNDVFKMGGAALHLVDESDVPTVVRTLLKSMNRENAKPIISTIRLETVDLAKSSIGVLLDVIANAFRIYPIGVKVFLEAVSVERSQLSTLDVFTLLILLKRDDLRRKIMRCILDCIAARTLSLDQMTSVFQSSDVMEPHMQSLWIAAQELLQAGNSSKILFEWARRLYTILLTTYTHSRIEILSSLLPICSATDSSRPGETLPSALTASQILLEICSKSPTSLEGNINILEELMYHWSAGSVPIEIFHCISASLATLARQNRSQNSLFIYVQKQFFSGNISCQRSGLVCASHLIKQSIPDETMIPELANLISFIMRLMPNLVPENALHILDLITYNVDHLPKDLVQTIVQGSIEPLIDITQLQPPLHPQEKKQRPNFECSMNYPTTIRGKGPLLKCSTYAEKQMKGFKDPPMYIYLLFTAYLRSSWNLNAKILQYSMSLPSEERMEDIQGEHLIFRSWCYYVGYSLAVAVYHQFRHIFPEVQSSDAWEDLYHCTSEINPLLPEMQQSIVTALSHTIHLKIEFQNTLSQVEQGEYAQTVQDQMQYIKAMQVPSVDATTLMNTLPYLAQHSKSTGVMTEAVHLLRMEVTAHLQGNRGVSPSFVISDTALQDHSEMHFLQTLIKSGALRGAIKAALPVARTLDKDRRALRKEKDPIDKDRLDAIYQDNLRLLSECYLIIRDVLEWTSDHNGALMEVVVFTIAKAMTHSTTPPRSQDSDVRTWMESIYQILIEHLMLVQDGCLVVLILDILVTMTRGLKKSTSVADVILGTMKTLYPTARFDLLDDPHKSTKRESKFRLEKSLFALLFRCASHPSSLLFIKELVQVLDEYVDQVVVHEENLVCHPIYQNLTEDSFSVYLEALLGSLSRSIIQPHIATDANAREFGTGLLLLRQVLGIHYLIISSKEKDTKPFKEMTPLILSSCTMIVHCIQKKIQDTIDLLADLGEDLQLAKALILISRDLVKAIKKMSTLLKKGTRSGERKVKERQALPKLVFKMESLSHFLEEMFAAYNLDAEMDYAQVLGKVEEEGEESWDHSQDAPVRLEDDDEIEDFSDGEDSEGEEVSASDYLGNFAAKFDEEKNPEFVSPLKQTLFVDYKQK
eukprot:TRINITY_DN7657_c0_g1_i1.p1 TRINITY_DN7657_c0_g1~~TRINITY_DN7657_c0_g1_i1.p1  ORF type:complete len:1232 (+),score=319.96 TRINITY_DN7657_c0_g1_i1:26-3721(+)